jgi:hypothetical protein
VAVREADKANEKGNIDEIKQYRDARWVTPPEVLQRIYDFDLSKVHPPVKQLQLHLHAHGLIPSTPEYQRCG